jgi:uncharacterized protein
MGLRAFFQEVGADLRHNDGGPTWDWRDFFSLIAISALLTVFYYWGRPRFYRRNMQRPMSQWLETGGDDLLFGVLPYSYWAVASLVIRVAIPCLIIIFVFKEPIRDYGYRLKGAVSHGKIYLLLYAVMFPVVLGVSYTRSFQHKYPFYKNAMLGAEHFLTYQIFYGVQFIALEAFFRGFMLFALHRRFGYYAIPIMTIPYCMIHFGKPPAETFGAIIAGLALGYLALKSKSWVYGAALHWGIGITMDLLAILQKGGFK